MGFFDRRNDISQTAQDVSLRLQQLAANIPWILLVSVLAPFFLKRRRTVTPLCSSAHWAFLRGIQDYVNTPRVMGKGLDLHPLLAIFAILVGGEIAGVLGVFLSIPTVGALWVLWLNWTRQMLTHKAA